MDAQSVGVGFYVFWLALGAVGLVGLWRKGYLRFFRLVGDLGCFGWMLYGWALGLFIILLPVSFFLNLGGITLLAAWLLPSKHLRDHVPAGSYTPRDAI